MSPTPEEIAEYPLRRAVRGYNVMQVDELLDRVADRIEELERDLAETRDELASTQRRLDELGATQAAVDEIRAGAERASEEAVAAGRARAATVVSEAEARADALLVAAHREADDVRTERMRELQAAQAAVERRIDHLDRVADEFESRLRGHLEAHLQLLAERPELDEAGRVRGPESAFAAAEDLVTVAALSGLAEQAALRDPDDDEGDRSSADGRASDAARAEERPD